MAASAASNFGHEDPAKRIEALRAELGHRNAQIDNLEKSTQSLVDTIEKNKSSRAWLLSDNRRLQEEVQAGKAVISLLQRQVLESQANPLVEQLQRKVSSSKIKSSKITRELRASLDEATANYSTLSASIAEIRKRANLLDEESTKAATEREEASRLFRECRQRFADQQAVVAKLRSELEGSMGDCALLRQRLLESVKVKKDEVALFDAMRTKFEDVLVEIVQAKEATDAACGKLREENGKLAVECGATREALMAYFLCMQHVDLTQLKDPAQADHYTQLMAQADKTRREIDAAHPRDEKEPSVPLRSTRLGVGVPLHQRPYPKAGKARPVFQG